MPERGGPSGAANTEEDKPISAALLAELFPTDERGRKIPIKLQGLGERPLEQVEARHDVSEPAPVTPERAEVIEQAEVEPEQAQEQQEEAYVTPDDNPAEVAPAERSFEPEEPVEAVYEPVEAEEDEAGDTTPEPDEHEQALLDALDKSLNPSGKKTEKRIADELAGQLKPVHFADLTDAMKEQAIDVAEQRLKKEIEGDDSERAHKLRKIVRGIWKGNIGREHYRQKYITEARNAIEEAQNLYVDQGLSNEEFDQEAQQILTRFMQDDQEVLRKGESSERVASKAERALRSKLRPALKKYMNESSSFGAEELRQEAARAIHEVWIEHPEFETEYKLVVDNLQEVADQIIAITEGLGGKDEVDKIRAELIKKIQFFEDKAKAGLDTEVMRSRVDRLIEKMHRIPGLRMINEASLGTAVGIAYSVGFGATRNVVARVAGTVAPGLAAGLFAAGRERRAVRGERINAMRSLEAGGSKVEGTTREAELHETTYGLMTHQEAMKSIEHSDSEPITPERAEELFAALAEIKARQQFGDREGAGLLAFSSIGKVESERTELLLRTAELRRSLAAWYELASPEERAAVGKGGSFEEILDQKVAGISAELKGEVKEKDRQFKRIQRRQVGRAALAGTLSGLTFGLAGQEGAAIFDGQDGIFGAHLFKGVHQEHQTFLRSIFTGHHGKELPGASKVADSFSPASAHAAAPNHVALPGGLELHHTAGDTYTVPGGHLDAASAQYIQDHLGGRVEHERIVTGTSSHVVEHNARSYGLAEHRGTAHINRSYWEADKPTGNPLRLSAPTRNANGDYVYSIAGMTESGSAHDGQTVNVPELVREGKMHLFLSANEGSQSHPFEIKFNHNGQAIIDKDSTVAHTLFSHRGNQVTDRSRYAEVAQVIGNHHGTKEVRVFATGEGQGVDRVREVVTSHHYRDVDVVHLPEPPAAGGPAAPEAPGGGSSAASAASVSTEARDGVPASAIPIVSREPLSQNVRSRVKEAEATAAAAAAAEKAAEEERAREEAEAKAKKEAKKAKKKAKKAADKAADAKKADEDSKASEKPKDNKPEPTKEPKPSRSEEVVEPEEPEERFEPFESWDDWQAQVTRWLKQAGTSDEKVALLNEALALAGPAFKSRAAKYILRAALGSNIIYVKPAAEVGRRAIKGIQAVKKSSTLARNLRQILGESISEGVAEPRPRRAPSGRGRSSRPPRSSEPSEPGGPETPPSPEAT